MNLMPSWLRLMLAMSVLMFSAAGQAHLLKVFAYLEGDTLHGHAYFAGGNAATGATILVLDDHAQILDSLTPDAKGEFSYRLTQPGVVVVVADTGDGHKAKWQLDYQPEGAAQTKPMVDDEQPEVTGGITPILEPALPAALGQAPRAEAMTDEKLVQLIEQAVARQIGPLRQQLEQAQSRAKLADIIGGIGFIFGVFGCLMWWRNRK